MHIWDVEAQSDGKIVVLGYFDSFTSLEGELLVRLHPNGTVDHSFNVPPLEPNIISSILLQPDDKILVAQNSTDGTNGIIRLNPDGSLDQSFDLGWTRKEWTEYISPVGIQSDGKILAVGQFTIPLETTNYGIARFETNGNFDPSFTPQFSYSGQPAYPYDAKIQPDGKILVTGAFDKLNDEPIGSTIRLNPNGTLDRSFSFNTNVYASYSQFYDLQADGKIIMAGPLGVVRFNADGSLDPRFNPGLGVAGTNRYVVSARSQQGTNLLVYGRFEYYDGVYRKSIARVNSDGTLDPTFDADLQSILPYRFPGMQENLVINAVAVLHDQSFLVAGSFTHVLGESSSSLVRFTADGEFDATFQAFQPAIRDASFTSDGYYQFFIEGHRGRSYRVEASSDLVNWSPLRNFIIVAEPFHYIDLRPNAGLTFYRITAI